MAPVSTDFKGFIGACRTSRGQSRPSRARDRGAAPAAAIHEPAVPLAAAQAPVVRRTAAPPPAALSRAVLRPGGRAGAGTGGSGVATHVDVNIHISNACVVTSVPQTTDVPAGRTVTLTYCNRSSDHHADIWLSYGSGYLGLPTGGVSATVQRLTINCL